MQTPNPSGSFLDWKQNIQNMYFYKKSIVIYDLTFSFTEKYFRYFEKRTVEQMVQAARSGKQNFVEGFADGLASSEMKIKLIAIGKGSLQELREDYEDYLRNRNLMIWDNTHPRYAGMVEWCKYRNDVDAYKKFFDKWNDEEMANVGLTLIHYVDRMLESYLKRLEQEFIQNGGLKERMYYIRTEYKNCQKYKDYYRNYKQIQGQK